MSAELLINGQTLQLRAKSDVLVAQRVVRHMQRRIDENDWRPYRSQDHAIKAWSRLGGIRLQVMRALGLI